MDLICKKCGYIINNNKIERCPRCYSIIEKNRRCEDCKGCSFITKKCNNDIKEE